MDCPPIGLQPCSRIMHAMHAQACGQKACPSSTAAPIAVPQPAPFICRQRDPSGSSPACSAAPRASSHLHHRQRRRGRRLHPLQIAAGQRGDAGRSTDLWSEDLTDTSWGAGWETAGNGDEQREVPQIWPEAEVGPHKPPCTLETAPFPNPWRGSIDSSTSYAILIVGAEEQYERLVARMPSLDTSTMEAGSAHATAVGIKLHVRLLNIGP